MNINQVCEMHVAGYKFFVLDNAFLTHRGWKFLGKFYANKDVDNGQNWLLFNYQFKVFFKLNLKFFINLRNLVKSVFIFNCCFLS